MNSSVDIINIGVSSKGRRIIPALKYWTGKNEDLYFLICKK